MESPQKFKEIDLLYDPIIILLCIYSKNCVQDLKMIPVFPHPLHWYIIVSRWWKERR